MVQSASPTVHASLISQFSRLAQRSLLPVSMLATLFLTGCGFDDADNGTTIPVGNFVSAGPATVFENESSINLLVKFNADIPENANIIWAIGNTDATEEYPGAAIGADYTIDLTRESDLLTFTITPVADSDNTETIEFFDVVMSAASDGVAFGDVYSRRVYIINVDSTTGTKPVISN